MEYLDVSKLISNCKVFVFLYVFYIVVLIFVFVGICLVFGFDICNYRYDLLVYVE